MKKAWAHTPKILRYLFLLVCSFTALFVLMRLIFWIVYDAANAPLNTDDFLRAMWLGFRFDLRLSLVIILPLFFLAWIKALNPFESKHFYVIWQLYLTIVFSGLAMSYIIDFAHYAYLNSRLNFTATRFLADAAIAADMVWESYPVIWILLAYFSVILAFVWMIQRFHQQIARSPATSLSRSRGALIGFIAFLWVGFGIHGRLAQYPLRWSEAAFSQHPFAAQLTYNPVHYFFDTWKNGRINYDLAAAKESYTLMADFLGVPDADQDPETLFYQRHIPAKEGLGDKPNIILILVESYASYKTSLSGNPLDPTPFTQSVADQGYFFKNFFTPSTGTARSVFTTITGMPDVELQGTSSRNPLVVDQHSIMNEFDGYAKYYFIGGSASWGNIRGILTKNITNLQLYEEGDYSSPRNDVWGISDIDLFREADAVLKKEDKPFIAIIQTSGNHRPYTIPDQSYGFELQHPGDEKVQPYGFQDEKEFNAYRLMDYSIAHFSELAKKSGYDQNTIFVLWGDHGIDGFAGKHTYKGESSSHLGLGSYRVPLVFWSPDLIKNPKIVDSVVSEVDVLASVAGLVGQSYNATTMGRDIFDSRYDNSRYAFTIQHSNPPRIGLITQDYYFNMLADGTRGGLYDIRSETPRDDLSSQYPELREKLQALTLGYYKSAQYMLHHNKQSQVKKK